MVGSDSMNSEQLHWPHAAFHTEGIWRGEQLDAVSCFPVAEKESPPSDLNKQIFGGFSPFLHDLVS